MAGAHAAIERAVGTLTYSVGEELIARGWSRREVASVRWPVFTRSNGNGLFAVVQWRLTGGLGEWPADVGVTVGLGEERALNLMALVTRRPRPELVTTEPPVSGPDFAVVLEKNKPVVPAVHQLVAYAEAQAVVLGTSYPDAAAVERELRPEGAGETQEHLILLSAMGELDAARSGLTHYAEELDRDTADREERRFVRQLTRWLDAGGPTPPPIEQTLALLPPLPTLRRQPGGFNWSAARTEGQARRAAFDAVRAQREGKTADALQELLAQAYESRGVDASASGTAVTAGILAAEEGPFARARSAVTAIRMMTMPFTGLVRLVKSGPQPVSAWAQPPDRASYEVGCFGSRQTVVELDPDADAWLREVCDTSGEPLGHWLEVWLTREDGALVAHIGTRRVGTIPAADADAFNQALEVAQYFDEDPVLNARLTRAPGITLQVLEVLVPLPCGPPKTATAVPSE